MKEVLRDASVRDSRNESNRRSSTYRHGNNTEREDSGWFHQDQYHGYKAAVEDDILRDEKTTGLLPFVFREYDDSYHHQVQPNSANEQRCIDKKVFNKRHKIIVQHNYHDYADSGNIKVLRPESVDTPTYVQRDKSIDQDHQPRQQTVPMTSTRNHSQNHHVGTSTCDIPPVVDRSSSTSPPVPSTIQRRGGVAIPFPWKLYEMLQDAENNEHVEYMNGTFQQEQIHTTHATTHQRKKKKSTKRNDDNQNIGFDENSRMKMSPTSIIRWQPHGRCFFVENYELLQKFLLPKYFKLTKVTSFQRYVHIICIW
jgi:HSF-type DNA-binding